MRRSATLSLLAATCLSVLQGGSQAQEQNPQGMVAAPQGIDGKRFVTLDQENRWVVYRRNVTENPARITAWINFLEAHNDFALLESIAVYEGYQMLFSAGMPGKVLYQHDAPQWMRVALWNTKRRDSHNVQAASSALQSHPGRFLGWAKKYPSVRRLGGSSLLKEFEGVSEVDPGDQLAPLDPRAVILPFLDAPRELARLEPDAKFDKRKRYLFQVLRSIRAVSIAATFEEPYRTKLLHLMRHSNLEVRRTAMLEFTEFPPKQVPWSELLDMARNKELSDEDRRVALLAATYSDHPAVYLELHTVLHHPEHPAFRAALGRVLALGDGYTLKVLETLQREDLPESLGSRVASIEKTLEVQWKGMRAANAGPSAGQLLYRVAWAAHVEYAQADALLAWTREHCERRMQNPEFQRALRKIMQDPDTASIPRELHAIVREVARKILSGG